MRCLIWTEWGFTKQKLKSNSLQVYFPYRVPRFDFESLNKGPCLVGTGIWSRRGPCPHPPTTASPAAPSGPPASPHLSLLTLALWLCCWTNGCCSGSRPQRCGGLLLWDPTLTKRKNTTLSTVEDSWEFWKREEHLKTISGHVLNVCWDKFYRISYNSIYARPVKYVMKENCVGTYTYILHTISISKQTMWA